MRSCRYDGRYSKDRRIFFTRVLAARNAALRLPSVEDYLIAIAVEDNLRVAQVFLAALHGAWNATLSSAVGRSVLNSVLPDFLALTSEDWRARCIVFGRVVPRAGIPFVELCGSPLAARGDVAARRLAFVSAG